MKLKCDLIIQNMNNSSASTHQDKVHKSATIGLYRLRDNEQLEEEENVRSKCETSAGPLNNASAKSIIITIETKTLSLKYKIKKVETYTKFIAEGKATLKLIDENVFLLISNTISLSLINFISFLNIKMATGNAQANNVAKPTFVNKLLNKAQLSLGKNALKLISPLSDKEINQANKLRASKLVSAANSNGNTTNNINSNKAQQFVSSPVRAVDKNISLKRSLSTLNNDINSQMKSPSSFKRSISSSCISNEKNKCETASGLIKLTEEQKLILKIVESGRSLFFTGSGGTGKSFLISVIKKCLPFEKTFITGSNLR
jgi:ATP-dependent DNA helicase PIF1